MEFVKKHKIDCLILMAFFGFALLLPNNISIWTDELFTLDFVNLSIPELLKATAMDIHPPLYYLIVKFFFTLFPFINPAILGKFVSLILFFSFLEVTYRFIKANLNECIAVNYVLVVMGCKILHYCFEIRMYTFASSLVALAYISGYLLINKKCKKFAIVTNLAVLAAMYTHYYAVFAILPLLIYLTINLIKEHEVKLLIKSIFFQVVCYLPWIIYFISFLGINQSGFGTGYQVSLNQILTYIVVFFSNTNTFLTLITMVIYVVIVLMALRTINSYDVKFGFICLLSVFSIFVFGNTLGFVFDKFFSGKYLLLAWNVFVFGICLFLNNNKRSIYFVCSLFVLNVITYSYAIKDEFNDIKATEKFIDFLKGEGSVTCIGNYNDLCEYYSDNVVVELNGEKVSTDKVVLNSRIDTLNYQWFNPAQVDMYVYNASDYNAYLDQQH